MELDTAHLPRRQWTNNHPLLTGKIVLAHLKEMLDYYDRLNVAELEGDLLKALRAGNGEKMLTLYRRLLAARAPCSPQKRTPSSPPDAPLRAWHFMFRSARGYRRGTRSGGNHPVVATILLFRRTLCPLTPHPHLVVYRRMCRP